GGSIGGGEHRGAGLVAPEFLLEAAILLLQLPMLLLDSVGSFEPLPKLLAIGRIDRDGLIVLGRGELDGRARREHCPLGKRERAT
ncbi:MAG: hypothetical protein L3K03_06050, partial [Thermoplasmata archaeon]|nr:hypothetical protein [Thermoplasmata archaeon]